MKAPGALGRFASKVGFPASTASSSQTPSTNPTSDMSDLPTFTLFPRLPTELRTAIWRAALPCNVHIAELYIYNKRIAPNLSAHAVFRVNRESRAEAFAVLLSAPPPYSMPAIPERDVAYIDPRIWNDLPHMSVGKGPIRAAVIEIDRAHRFIAAALVDSDQSQFDSMSIDMRLYSPYAHNALSEGPLNFRGRPLRMEFFCVARKIGKGTKPRGLGGGFYVNSTEGEDGVVGFGGGKNQGSNKPVLRVVYVL